MIFKRYPDCRKRFGIQYTDFRTIDGMGNGRGKESYTFEKETSDTDRSLDKIEVDTS